MKKSRTSPGFNKRTSRRMIQTSGLGNQRLTKTRAENSPDWINDWPFVIKQFGGNYALSILRQSIIVVTASLLTSCSGSRLDVLSSTARSPVITETTSGVRFLMGLHDEGRLPGDSRDTHGEVKTEVLPLPLPETVTYPFSQTFLVCPTGATFTNHYTVGRLSKDSPWQLQKAWRTDSQGQTAEEWPVR